MTPISFSLYYSGLYQLWTAEQTLQPYLLASQWRKMLFLRSENKKLIFLKYILMIWEKHRETETKTILDAHGEEKMRINKPWNLRTLKTMNISFITIAKKQKKEKRKRKRKNTRNWLPLTFSFLYSSWLLRLPHLLLRWDTCYQLCFQTTWGPQKLHWSALDQTDQK